MTVLKMWTPIASEVAVAQGDGAREQAQAAREQAQAAREQAQAAREQAQEIRSAADELAQAAREAGQGSADGPGGKILITLPDGKTIEVNGAVPGELSQVLGMPPLEPRGNDDGSAPYVVGAIAIISAAVVMIVGFALLYRAKMRGLVKRGEVSPELSQRMARMETAIESVAIEVERISEGQRFTTRLLSERAPVEVPRG